MPRRRQPSTKPPTTSSDRQTLVGQGLVHPGPVRCRGEDVPQRESRRSMPPPPSCTRPKTSSATRSCWLTHQASVIAKGAEAGEVVRAGQMIVTVAHDDGADAVFDVPASLMRQVSPDALISIALTDDPAVHTVGRVRETAPQADPVTGSYRVKVGLTEWPEAMRLGATVTGETRMLARGGIELPATRADQRGKSAGCLGGRSGNVTLCPFDPSTLQRQDSSSIVVTRGLEGGDLVVTAGVHALRPGQKVRLLERLAMTRFNLSGLGDRASLDGLLPDAGARRHRHRLLHATGAQRGPHLHHQDDGGASAMAGRDAGGHAASGHRAARAQAAGDASPRLPEELHQSGPIDDLRVSQGIDRTEGGVGCLVSGSQEGATTSS